MVFCVSTTKTNPPKKLKIQLLLIFEILARLATNLLHFLLFFGAILDSFRLLYSIFFKWKFLASYV